MKECLIIFRGNKDSLVNTLLLLEEGYKVNLVYYNNMCSMDINVKKIYNKLSKKYGDRVCLLGIKNISIFFRNYINQLYNMPISEMLNKYGNTTISQINCLSCRLSMYIASIIICKKNNIKYVVDGSKSSYQDEMIDLFKELFQQYNISFLTPTRNHKDFLNIIKYIKSFVPKIEEAECLMGLPIKSIDNVYTCVNIYNSLLSLTNKLIEKYSDIELEEL